VVWLAVDRWELKPGSSWLCPTANHRERFLDMQERLRTARIVTLTTLSATAAVVAATGGWPMLAAAVVAVLAVAIGGSGLDRKRRPELWVFASAIVVLQLVLAFGALVSGGPRSLAPNLLAIPVLMVAARFSNRGLVVGAPVSALLVLVTTLGADPAYVADHPESLMVPLALVVCAAVYVSPLVASDVRHRADSTLDQLTGLLNRRALGPRFAEIAEQGCSPTSRSVSSWPTSTTSSRSTTATATASATRCCATSPTRCAVRCAPSSCSTGSGARSSRCCSPARPRATRRGSPTPCASQSRSSRPPACVTCSFGVATARGGDIVLDSLVTRADAALYAAKRLGRNRVERDDAAALVIG
jgi:GGDEF domain-containing protein